MYVAHDGTHSAGINHTLGDGSAAGCPARRASGLWQTAVMLVTTGYRPRLK